MDRMVTFCSFGADNKKVVPALRVIPPLNSLPAQHCRRPLPTFHPRGWAGPLGANTFPPRVPASRPATAGTPHLGKVGGEPQTPDTVMNYK